MPVIVAANLAVGRPWANVATWIIGGILAWGFVAGGLVDLAEGLASSKLDQARFATDAGWIVSGVAAAGFLFKAIRTDIARVLPIDVDSPVHTLALVLATVLFGTQVASLLFTDVLALLAKQPPVSLLDMVLDEVPLLLVALVGVGIYVRRTTRATMERLGFVRPEWWHLVLALAVAGIFAALLQGVDSANHYLLPDVAQRVDAVDQHLFGELAATGWIGIAAVALLPGICEEALFRGALQPRLGLLPTALLFTAIHTQYGLSLDLAGVLLVAVFLGLVRKYANTTASMSTHVAYNLLAGVSLDGFPLYAAVGVEVVLLVVAAIALWPRIQRGLTGTGAGEGSRD